MRDVFTPEQKTKVIEQLQKAQELSNYYYNKAASIGLHVFIEHTGFINEHIKIMQRAVNEGVDVTMLNNHTGEALDVKEYEIDYLAEKFACMFVPIFKNKASWQRFIKAAEREGCGQS